MIEAILNFTVDYNIVLNAALGVVMYETLCFVLAGIVSLISLPIMKKS